VKEIFCPPCGERVTGVDDDDLVTKVQTHAKSAHDMDLSRADILLQAEEPSG
jgi:predicted small metal-binding protein